MISHVSEIGAFLSSMNFVIVLVSFDCNQSCRMVSSNKAKKVKQVRRKWTEKRKETSVETIEKGDRLFTFT